MSAAAGLPHRISIRWSRLLPFTTSSRTQIAADAEARSQRSMAWGNALPRASKNRISAPSARAWLKSKRPASRSTASG
jgi:hypothetical protein